MSGHPGAADAGRPLQALPVRWTGDLQFGLVDEAGWTAGAIMFAVRLDLVTVWWGERTLAVMHRQALRGWLDRPALPLAVDDIELHRDRAGKMWLQIDARPQVAVPRRVVADLYEPI